MKKLICLVYLFVFTISAFSQNAKGLIVGDKAPWFEGTDQTGSKINLQELLQKGDVVLVFYRGQWCPHCNKELSHLSDSIALITAKGATVICITPETEDNIKKTIEKTKASFSILKDKGLSIMNNYKVSFAVDENTIAKYKKYGIDFEKANGTNGANLPIPATYVIGKNGTIKYAFFNPDYTKRATVQNILQNL